ncbi:crotonyl-CoA carboxylase/reductase [Amycolatopsis pithecellobii]|uniref:Crotonyl-CoA carboxylase/reductase n=1 Tax=Amycolatopsis pithecellobii TaxID=664692 RepID=A0A6N7Z0N8_9PSEU|nr:crotonyl-CoA carboxylase/reductase [Amycolatopsis pithecellobii]MTD53341.1 crotonyl-CoA carboxylase/reductase [Amycolatopsis pithecellobii]
MSELVDAVRAGADGPELRACPVPESYLAAHLRVEDVEMFSGEEDRDVRKSMKVGEVPMPELAPDEALVAVMAAGINYNTVWSAMFAPIPGFRFLHQLGRRGYWESRHDQPYHILGSDAVGVVVRVGAAVRRWKPGDRVVVHPGHIDTETPAGQDDGMMAEDQLAWGFETNFGSLAQFAVVRANQLLPKPPHLSWEEAATNLLCAGTAYRMLVSPRGARMKQGDVVLVWGATGGLGGYAIQLIRNGGGIPVGVVSSPEKAELLRDLGCDVVLDRAALGLGSQDVDSWRRLGKAIREQTGEDPHIVFEHVGKQTFGASVFVARRGGAIVTCGSSTGYEHTFDNRYLWMRLKRIIGSHGANFGEAAEVNRLLRLGHLVPTLSEVHPLEDAAEATRRVQRNEHIGKVAVLGLAAGEGGGIEDPATRERIGERRLTLYRRHAARQASR